MPKQPDAAPKFVKYIGPVIAALGELGGSGRPDEVRGAIAKALGDMRGIRRFGSAAVPMDEALVLAAVDVSGRGSLTYDVEVPIELIGTFDTTLAKEFFVAFATNAGITVHLHEVDGENAHHIIEAAFKALARALREALELDPRVDGVPSTKGSL